MSGGEVRRPPASVVVPTRDRPGSLARCLEAIAALDYPILEAVVVNDGPDPIDVVAAPFAGRLELTVVDGPGRGPAAARNVGAGTAAGEILAFTDDDCEPEPGWLRALADAAGADRVLVGGRTVNALPGNPYSAASQAIQDAVYAHYNADPDRARFFASHNVALPAAGFAELGGFDERLRTSEDRDLCHRWLEGGGRLVYEPDAVVRHSHRLDLAGYWRQHYGYGRGAYRHRRLRAGRGRGFDRSAAASSGILSGAARRALADRDFRRLGLLGVWQLANSAGIAREALSGRRRAPR